MAKDLFHQHCVKQRSFTSPGTRTRTRSHNYCILPNVQTSCFKSVLLIDVSLIVTNIYLVIFFTYFFAFLYSLYCHVNCCMSVCTMNY